MAFRRAVILVLVVMGGAYSIAGTPPPFRKLVAGAATFLLAYIYAQLTRPKG